MLDQTLDEIRNPSAATWPIWLRQLQAILRLEIRRNLLAARGLWVFFLAFSPALIAAVHSFFASSHQVACSMEHDSVLLAWMFQLFYLRLACFFGCLGIFVRSIRGEMVDKTLHYYLLAPLRRELLLVGKFLAGSLGSAMIFMAGGVTCFVLMYWHHGPQATSYLIHGEGLRQLGAYLGVTGLACVGYGAVFLALGQAFRNPVLPAVVFFGWEAVSGMLPATLQYLSVTFYLKPLFPVVLPVVGISGLFTVVVEPMPAWIAVLGLLAFAGAVVSLAAIRMRRIEIDHAAD